MLKFLWLIIVGLSILVGTFTGRLSYVEVAAFLYFALAFKLILGLSGILAFWLGIMQIAEEAGLVQKFARGLTPLLTRLFPEVPRDHPALGAITLNIAASMLGMGNAATPFGLRAMRELEKLNPQPGVATDAMCTFLAMNTSHIQVVPVAAMAVLIAGGSLHPFVIIVPSILATSCVMGVALIAAKTCAWIFRKRTREVIA